MIDELIDLQERVAAAMWKEEAMRAAPNVGKARNLEGFLNESEECRSRWLGLSRAAILEITHPTHKGHTRCKS